MLLRRGNQYFTISPATDYWGKLYNKIKQYNNTDYGYRYICKYCGMSGGEYGICQCCRDLIQWHAGNYKSVIGYRRVIDNELYYQASPCEIFNTFAISHNCGELKSYIMFVHTYTTLLDIIKNDRSSDVALILGRLQHALWCLRQCALCSDIQQYIIQLMIAIL